MALSLIDSLNSREDSILIWVVVITAIVAYATRENARGVWTWFVDVLRVVFPKLVLLFAAAAAYCATLVFAAERAGLWHTTALKETIYWFIGSGIVLVGNATRESPSDSRYLRKLLRHAIRLTIVIDFIVNVYVFSLAAELVIVPVIALLFGMQVVAENNPQYAMVRRVIDSVLIAIGLFLLAYFAIRAMTDLDGLLTRQYAEAFLVVPALTLAFIPALYCVAWVSQWEQEKLRRRFHPRFESPA